MVDKINNVIYSCELCNKKYKDKSGLWYHNKKYHSITCQKNDKNILNNVNQMSNINDKLILFCKKCNKQFNTRQAKWTHENKCIINNNLEEENKELKNTIKQQSQEIFEIKKYLMIF